MNLKVGDKVRLKTLEQLRSEGWIDCDGALTNDGKTPVSVNRHMRHVFGREVTITDMREDRYFGTYFRIHELSDWTFIPMWITTDIQLEFDF